jgi:hypothetical protein
LGFQGIGLCIGLGAQGGSKRSTRREDFASGRVVLRMLSEAWEIQLSDFKVWNGMLNVDYLGQVFEIVIGGVLSIFETPVR